MSVTVLLTEISTAIVSILKILLPGVAGAFVETFDAIAFTTNGDATTMTAAFGWIVLASILSLGIWLVRLIVNKAFGGSATRA